MHLEKTALFLLFSLTFVSVSAAQQQDPGNQTLSDETVSDVSVPGDTFYGFKRFRERMSLAMARAPLLGSPEKEAKVLSRNAE